MLLFTTSGSLDPRLVGAPYNLGKCVGTAHIPNGLAFAFRGLSFKVTHPDVEEFSVLRASILGTLSNTLKDFPTFAENIHVLDLGGIAGQVVLRGHIAIHVNPEMAGNHFRGDTETLKKP